MTNINPAVARLRRILSAALIAAATALGASTLTFPAIASAERVLDIGAYDDCVAQMWHNNPDQSDAFYREYRRLCCVDAGGVWDEDQPDDTQACKAPPAEDAERPLPPRVAPGAETTAPLEPAPGNLPTTQPFEPGPAKQG